MKFPWDKYEELTLQRRNTLQVFITNKCNMVCGGCFARNIRSDSPYIDIDEYKKVLDDFKIRGGVQINLLGGEPLLHPQLTEILHLNEHRGIKTTVYTNGTLIGKIREIPSNTKFRVSIYTKDGHKGIDKIDNWIKFDANFMISKSTTIDELLETADFAENECGCEVFFISSIRELDNPNNEFFDDTFRTMPVLQYKKIVHDFLMQYSGNMKIHISKRGVFESTTTVADNKCRFANYFIGGKIIQCPYDVVNLKYQSDYSFGTRYCQQNNTCLMSKIILKRRSS